MKWAIFLLLPIFNSPAFASWFCTDAGITRSENVFQACGVGVSDNEPDARNKSLEAARSEFVAVCRSSADCRNYQVIVNPKRLLCSKKEGEFTCRRLIEYIVTSKKKSFFVDKYEIQKEIEKQTEELRKLQQTAYEMAELSKIEKDIQHNEQKIEQKASAIESFKIKYEINRQIEWKARINIVAGSSTIDGINSTAGGYRLDFQYRIASWVGAEFNFEPGSKFSGDGINGSTGAVNFGIPLFISIGEVDPTEIYLKPLIEYRTIDITTETTHVDGSQLGYGLSLGRDFFFKKDTYVNGLSLEIAVRNHGDAGTSSSGKASFLGAVGFAIGW